MKNKLETKSYQDLLMVEELIRYLRIPELSNTQGYCNIVKHLKRMRDLPRIHI